LLVIEVAQSSLAYDHGLKLRAYALCGIREYWIVNLVDQRLDVYRDPEGGDYLVHSIAKRGQAVEAQAFPGEAFIIDEYLPPPR
jgi:Uma2 family endonuclease